MKKKLLIAAALVIPLVAYAGSIKTWSSGETLRSADLNSNFSHIHSTMVGGHGARLVDADVASNAAIAQSKVVGVSEAIPQVAKAFIRFAGAAVTTTCGATPCTVYVNMPAGATTGVVRTGAGIYEVTLATARADTSFVVLVNSFSPLAVCGLNALTTTLVTIQCVDLAGAATDAVVSLVIFDNA